MSLATLRKEYTDLIAADAKFWADADSTPDAAITADQRTEVKDRNKKIEELENQIVEAQEMEEGRKTNETRRRNGQTPATGLVTPGMKASEGLQVPQSVGERFIADPEFKRWHQNVVRDGRVISAKLDNSPSVELKTLVTGLSSTQAGALFINQFLGLQDPTGLFARPLTIVDLITTMSVTSDAVDYAIMGTPTNAAATVAEATATSGASGTKPESAIALASGTATVRTIAHWIPVTRRALADAGQIRGMIDAFLRYGVEEELEDQVLSGGGTGEDFTGIASTPNTQSQAWDTDILTTTRKARTKVRVVGRATPTAYVMHPTDWQTIDLLKDNEARYYFGGPSAIGNPRLWGLPVVESEACTVGEGYVADWKWAVLWLRENINILMTDSHSDYFIRNLIVILAEMRAAFGLIRPQAFVEIDLAA